MLDLVQAAMRTYRYREGKWIKRSRFHYPGNLLKCLLNEPTALVPNILLGCQAASWKKTFEDTATMPKGGVYA